MQRDSWSVTDLDTLFKEAAQTLRLLPGVIRKQKLNYWPDTVQSHWDMYNYHNVGMVRLTPTTNQVTRLDFALQVGLEIDREDNQLLWRVGMSAVFRERGPKWRKLAQVYHCDARTVKRRYEQALIRLYYHLKKG